MYGVGWFRKKICLGFRNLENKILKLKRNDIVFQFNFKKINLDHLDNLQHISWWVLCLLLLKIGTTLAAKESKIVLAFLLQVFFHGLFLFQLSNSIFLKLTY